MKIKTALSFILLSILIDQSKCVIIKVKGNAGETNDADGDFVFDDATSNS